MSTGNIPPRAYRSAKATQLLAKRAQLADDSIYVKHGTAQEIQREIEAINFVRQHTSVPVPSVVETFIDENPTAETSWFSMKEIPGSSLATAWVNMTPMARSKTKVDLQNYLLEMRNIPPRNLFCIGSCSGGPAYDHRLNNGFPCGPFTSESDFNDYLVASVEKCPKKELVSYYRQQMADDHGLAFTYADLDGDHLLVDLATYREDKWHYRLGNGWMVAEILGIHQIQVRKQILVMVGGITEPCLNSILTRVADREGFTGVLTDNFASSNKYILYFNILTFATQSSPSQSLAENPKECFQSLLQ